jgi:hypothetical protein
MILGHDRGRAVLERLRRERRRKARQQACKPAASATGLVQDQIGVFAATVVPGQRARTRSRSG